MRRGELVQLVREQRAASGTRVIAALSNKRLQLARAREASKKPRRSHPRSRS